MTRALVTIEDPTRDRDRDLLERAKSFALGDDTDLVVLALATPDEYDDVVETLEAIGRAEHTSYDEDAVLEALSGDVADLADDLLDGDVAYDLHVEVVDEGQQADVVVDTAERADCDHVFVPGTRRSPTGKAVFGDRTQQVLLNFPGFVTVEMT